MLTAVDSSSPNQMRLRAYSGESAMLVGSFEHGKTSSMPIAIPRKHLIARQSRSLASSPRARKTLSPLRKADFKPIYVSNGTTKLSPLPEESVKSFFSYSQPATPRQLTAMGYESCSSDEEQSDDASVQPPEESGDVQRHSTLSVSQNGTARLPPKLFKMLTGTQHVRRHSVGGKLSQKEIDRAFQRYFDTENIVPSADVNDNDDDDSSGSALAMSAAANAALACSSPRVGFSAIFDVSAEQNVHERTEFVVHKRNGTTAKLSTANGLRRAKSVSHASAMDRFAISQRAAVSHSVRDLRRISEQGGNNSSDDESSNGGMLRRAFSATRRLRANSASSSATHSLIFYNDDCMGMGAQQHFMVPDAVVSYNMRQHLKQAHRATAQHRPLELCSCDALGCVKHAPPDVAAKFVATCFLDARHGVASESTRALLACYYAESQNRQLGQWTRYRVDDDVALGDVSSFNVSHVYIVYRYI